MTRVMRLKITFVRGNPYSIIQLYEFLHFNNMNPREDTKTILNRVFSARIYHLDGSYHLCHRHDRDIYKRDMDFIGKSDVIRSTESMLASVLANDTKSLLKSIIWNNSIHQRFNIFTDVPFAINSTQTEPSQDPKMDNSIRLNTVVKGCNLMHCALLSKLRVRLPQKLTQMWLVLQHMNRPMPNRAVDIGDMLRCLLELGANDLHETTGIDYYQAGSDTNLRDVFLGGCTALSMSIVLDYMKDGAYEEDGATEILSAEWLKNQNHGKLTFNSFDLLLAANDINVATTIRNIDQAKVDQNPAYTLDATIRNLIFPVVVSKLGRDENPITTRGEYEYLIKVLQSPRNVGLEKSIDWGLPSRIDMPSNHAEFEDKYPLGSHQHQLLTISVMAMIFQFHKELPMFPLFHWARLSVSSTLPDGKGNKILKTILDNSLARLKFFEQDHPKRNHFDVMLNKLKTMSKESNNHGRTRLGYEHQMLADVLLDKQCAFANPLNEEQRAQLKSCLKNKNETYKKVGLFKESPSHFGHGNYEFAGGGKKGDNCLNFLHSQRLFEAVLNKNKKELLGLVSQAQGNPPSDTDNIIFKHINFQMRFDVEQGTNHLDNNFMKHGKEVEKGTTHIARSCNALHCARLVSSPEDITFLELVFQLSVDPMETLSDWCMNTRKQKLFSIAGCSSASLLTMSLVLDKAGTNISECTQYIQSKMEEICIKKEKELELIEERKVMEELKKYILEEEENDRKARQQKKKITKKKK